MNSYNTFIQQQQRPNGSRKASAGIRPQTAGPVRPSTARKSTLVKKKPTSQSRQKKLISDKTRESGQQFESLEVDNNQ
jgi:cytochrome oxidase assembly protein ShyY1